MTNGAVFQLVTNDGKQDRILMATAFLNKRLKMIYQARANDPSVRDATPTLVDIEKTHVLFVNAHFKPFASIGYEYMKSNPTISSSALGSGGANLQYSIPQYGDFFGDMAVHFLLNAPTVTRTDDATTATDNTAGGASNAPAFRYCAFPGERLFRTVNFKVNGNDLDSYTPNSAVMFRNFLVGANRRHAWNRCMGQETAVAGWFRQPGVDCTGTSDAATGVNGGSTMASHRLAASVLRGYQTPKLTPDNLEMWIPLLFWFNLDPRLAVPSVSIPHGQRFIEITLAAANQIYGLVPRGVGTWTSPRGTLTAASNEIGKAELYINNIFVNPEIHDIFIKRIGFNLIRVHREQVSPIASTGESQILLNNMKWPIETLYVGARVASYASTTTARHFDNWSCFRTRTWTAYNAPGVPTSVGTTPITVGTSLAWGVAASGVSTVTGGVGTLFTALAAGDTVSILGSLQTVTVVTSALVMTVAPGFNAALVLDLANLTVLQCVNKPGALKAEVPVETDNLDHVSLLAHSINLYQTTETAFYTDLMPFVYGGPNFSAPDDRGLIMINFCLYPGAYQPSGYMNVSRAREFYIKFDTTVAANTLELVTIASALNFLLITDGSAIIRYST
jgi:hypothetical protein